MGSLTYGMTSAGQAIGGALRDRREEKKKKKEERRQVLMRLANTDEYKDKADDLEAYSLAELQGLEDSRTMKRAEEIQNLNKQQLLNSLALQQENIDNRGFREDQQKRMADIAELDLFIKNLQASKAPGRAAREDAMGNLALQAATARTGALPGQLSRQQALEQAAIEAGANKNAHDAWKFETIQNQVANPQEIAEGLLQVSDVNGNSRVVDTTKKKQSEPGLQAVKMPDGSTRWLPNFDPNKMLTLDGQKALKGSGVDPMQALAAVFGMQGDGGEMPAQGEADPKVINTQAEYDALPSGAVYIDPDDGKPYRKP